MSKQTTNSSPPTHGLARANSNSSYFRRDGGSAASPTASSAMQLDVPRGRREGLACHAAAPSEGTGTAESAFLPPRRQQQPRQTGATNNVGELVAKAKKAAVSLWMIVHAQNCRQERCAHRGCAETKLLLSHVKTCPAGPDSPCPTNCKGCNETRKLLAHYRRCKDTRTKQLGMGRRRSGPQPDRSCLVCSLMARHAKNVMDRTNGCGSRGGGKGERAASLFSDGKFNVERRLAGLADDRVCVPVLGNLGNVRRTPSMTLMPPPPPRSLSARASPTIEINTANESFGTPSDSSPCPTTYNNTHSYSSYKCRSGEPSVPFPILRRSPERVDAADEGPAGARRRRAESCDWGRARRVRFAPAAVARTRGGGRRSPPAPSRGGGGAARPRSASLGGDATLAPARGCDTIAEDGAEHDEPHFSD